MLRNQSNLEKKFDIESPLNVNIQLGIGVYLITILFLCLFVNTYFLVVYKRSKEIKKKPTVTIIVAITILNLVSAIALPFKIHSSLNGR
jgi:formate/nitrite transporter FocA (FNT family)